MYIYLGACESVRMRLCMCLDFKGQYYLCQYTSGSNNQKAINFPRDYFLVVTSLALLVLNLRSLTDNPLSCFRSGLRHHVWQLGECFTYSLGIGYVGW